MNEETARLNEPDIELDDHVIFAIGDIHGCARELGIMLNYIKQYETERTKLVYFLGDLCDRGPEPKQVLDLTLDTLEKYEGSVLHVGNHDELLWRWLSNGGECLDDDTLTQWSKGMWGGDSTVSQLLDTPGDVVGGYYERLFGDGMLTTGPPDITIVGNLVFCHGGIEWDRPLNDQTKRMVRWSSPAFFRPETVLPEHKYRICLYGHWMIPRPIVWSRGTGIDTGCHSSGRLTAAVIDEGIRFVQTRRDQENVIEVKAKDVSSELG